MAANNVGGLGDEIGAQAAQGARHSVNNKNSAERGGISTDRGPETLSTDRWCGDKQRSLPRYGVRSPAASSNVDTLFIEMWQE